MAHFLPARPVTFRPSLAMALGLNEAILIQYIHAHSTNGKEYLGKRWFVAPVTDLETIFPYFSISTIRRTILNLREQGYLIVERPRIPWPNWYRLDYDRLDNLAMDMEKGVL